MMLVGVRDLRKARGLTQDELGRMVGVSQKRIARIESHEDATSLGQIVEIAKALGYEIKASQVAGWQAPSTSHGASVYILPHERLPAIKIGKAIVTTERAESIGGIDVGGGHELLLKSEADAFRVERILHRTFQKWRIAPKQALSIGLPEGGYTEWFRDECHERVLQFVRANVDVFDCTLAAMREEVGA